MKIACFLAPLYWNLGIFGAIDNPYNLPIGLCIVRHEAFEMRLGDSMPSFDVVEVMPKKHLCILVFELEVGANNGHDTLVGLVVYVASHGGPFGHALYMIRHDPNILEIPAWVHEPNQINPTIGAYLKYLEEKDFLCLVTLAQKLIALDLGPSANTSKLSDAIHNP